MGMGGAARGKGEPRNLRQPLMVAPLMGVEPEWGRPWKEASQVDTGAWKSSQEGASRNRLRG